MFKAFFSNSTKKTSDSDFGYLNPSDLYFDSACQTLRPQSVIDAEVEYYTQYNSCGHRVKYAWGEKTDKKVLQTRQLLLDLVGAKADEYTVAFSLNTTFGINTILHQLPNNFERIVSSEIEHNSVFLNCLTASKNLKIPRILLKRVENPNGKDHGNLIYTKSDLKKAIVLVNTMSNIDGQELGNLAELITDTHEAGGIVLLDSCQTLGHNPKLLYGLDFDGVFGSGHKMNAPSVGFIIVKKKLVSQLECFWIGGSTVQDVKRDSYELIEAEDEIYARIEPGLQNYAGIVGLGESLRWQKQFKISLNPQTETSGNYKNWLQTLDSKTLQNLDSHEYLEHLSNYLADQLSQIPDLTRLNHNPSSIVSFYSKKIDSHKLGTFLDNAGIMCRTGYHCCHYYLKDLKKLPPLFRISLGLHNNGQQIDVFLEKLKAVLKLYNN
jgi:selenocysteine lyase/cysteine desulfurase